MPVIGIQYLEPPAPDVSANKIQDRLSAAFDILPISMVMLGWDLPPAFETACAQVADRRGVPLYRWQPLLTGDGALQPRPDWQTIGLSGKPVAGFRNLPEFTFFCPNRPAVRMAVMEHIESLLKNSPYQGLFLDRIRFPSPAANPIDNLACFCPDCQAAAHQDGIDLLTIQNNLSSAFMRQEGALQIVRRLLAANQADPSTVNVNSLEALLDFRQRSITNLVREITGLCRAHRKFVGLDCFSPSLTRMVGQDLPSLSWHADWIKIMSYGHALGPAGLPFELLELANWLTRQYQLPEPQVLGKLAEFTKLPLPKTGHDLRNQGLSPEALVSETRLGHSQVSGTLLSGAALVELAGVNHMDDQQASAELLAYRQGGADGLVLSWDLWHISDERLELVKQTWTG